MINKTSSILYILQMRNATFWYEKEKKVHSKRLCLFLQQA